MHVPARLFALLACSSLLAGLAGCGESRSCGELLPTGCSQPLAADFAFQLSEPQVAPVTTAGSATPAAAGTVGRVYVSLVPGAVPTGRSASVRNLTTRAVAGPLEVVDGGFDPVALLGAAGDTIEIVVTLAGGNTVRAAAVVASRRPPVVIRTVPPRQGTDVPLNVRAYVVFSEPMAPGRITSGTVRLLRGDSAVASRVTLSSDGLRAELVPDVPLAAASQYTLAVQAGVTDQGGEALEQAYWAAFVTESGTAPVARVVLDPDRATLAPSESLGLTATVFDAEGNRIARAVSWRSSNEAIATVGENGLVRAQGIGRATILAAAEGQVDSAIVDVGRLVFASISAGIAHACGVTTDGDAYCWGLLVRAAAPTWTVDTSTAPVPVPGGHKFVMLSAGENHNCGVTTDSAAYCWGYNDVGQLGDGTTVDSDLPVRVSGNQRFRSVSVGTIWNGAYSCGVTSDGAAYCWGDGRSGQMGNGRAWWADSVSYRGSLVPVPVAGGMRFESIVTHFGAVCGAAADGTAQCWGEAGSAFGLEDTPAVGFCYWEPDPNPEYLTPCYARPTHMFGELRFKLVSPGMWYVCGLLYDGTALCGGGWRSLQMEAVGSTAAFRTLSTGWTNDDFTCGVTVTDETLCWGSIPYPNSWSYTRTPQPVAGGLRFVSVSVGDHFACGVTAAGVAYCWGGNDVGQLGAPVGGFSATPVKVMGQP